MSKNIKILIFINTLFISILLLFMVNTINKINKNSISADITSNIMLKMINREIVEDTYLNFIDNDSLVDDLLAYNEKTFNLKIYTTRYAAEIIDNLFHFEENHNIPIDLTAASYDITSDEIKGMIHKISTYALYKNATELIMTDKDLSQIVIGELGSSYGVWSYHIHDGETIFNETVSIDELNDYFKLIDKITYELKEM